MEDGTKILLIKIGAMIILGFGSLIAGMMPVIVKKFRGKAGEKNTGGTHETKRTHHVDHSHAPSQQGSYTSFLLCFGGGVLLFTSFIHLLPELREEIETSQEKKELPHMHGLTELLFIAGFFLVYLIEEVVHTVLAHGKDSCPDDLLHRTMSLRCTNSNQSKRTPCDPSAPSNIIQPRVSLTSTTSCCKTENGNNYRSPSHFSTRDNKRITTGEMTQSENSCTTTNSLPLESSKTDSKYDLESLSKNLTHASRSVKTVSSARGLMTVLALSFHAIFEGLVVGLDKSADTTINLTGAIATHKFVIAFCIGMELYTSKTSCKAMFSYLMVFAMVTPIGMMIGMIMKYVESSNGEGFLGPTPAILQALAAGTLLYVVFFEILAREKANEQSSGFLKFLGVIVGFLVMLALALLVPHDHSHEHGGGHHDHHDHDHHANETLCPCLNQTSNA